MENVIGLEVRYFDYLGLERFGNIVATEPYADDVVYVYIEDGEPEYNIHRDVINGTPVAYADLRLSTEVNLVEKKR